MIVESIKLAAQRGFFQTEKTLRFSELHPTINAET